MKVIITGCAGFIGMHVSRRMLELGVDVVGLDNLNDYYDLSLKKSRLSELRSYSNFSFIQHDIADSSFINYIFMNHRPNKVVNLAAQAGVRYSLENPQAYIDSNIQGFINILEACRNYSVEHLVYASSSSVYGGNKELPFEENHRTDTPISLYAATKKSNELMAHTYSHLFNIPCTGLRFFTVYGPWGRPDMAPFKFTKAILAGEPIKIYNHGQMLRDFTYIDDIVEGIVRVLYKPPTLANQAKNNLFNIGNSSGVKLLDYISILEKELGLEAKKDFMPIQPGDMQATLSDTRSLHEWVGFKPSTPIEIGVKKFVSWYEKYYTQEFVN